MRTAAATQMPLTPQIGGHEHMAELEEMSAILDRHPQAARLVLADLVSGGIDPKRGRAGQSGEQVLRSAIIKQMNGYSYEQLAFHLADSMSYRAFCRFGFAAQVPSAAVLQDNIKKVQPDTMETINRMLIEEAREQGIEDGQKVRADCTVMESNIHEPTDSSLLWDCVRVLTRHLVQIQKVVAVPFANHSRVAKRRFVGILNAKSAERVVLYRDLIKISDGVVVDAKRAVAALAAASWANGVPPARLTKFAKQLRNYIELTERVLDQTRRRVLDGEAVPSPEKVVSIFEPHTDIIVKDRRDTYYGHKVCLTAGASGLVLDLVVLAGNPADSALPVKMVERQIEIYGRAPHQAVFDGGFTSATNLADIKKLKVKDVAFSKSRGIAISAMVKSSWVYRQLKRFRAGIESIISCLKRCFGWDRCTWSSLASFKAYAWTSTVASNLLVLARHALR